MRLFGQSNYRVEARQSRATHTTEGGTYHIGELAFIQKVADQDYVTSVGFCGRKDPMSTEAFEIRRQAEETKPNSAE